MNTNINRVLLINPPWYRIFGGSSQSSPLGLCYIAGVLEKYGYNVSIYNADYVQGLKLISEADYTKNYNTYLHVIEDLNHKLWKEVAGVIAEQAPEIVGITVPTAKYGSALNISKLVKDFNPQIPVVWGGVHPTILPEETIKNKNIDIVVRGEGEYTFLELIKNLGNLDKVLGITYKDEGGIVNNKSRPFIEDLDELPFPARHLVLGNENYYPEAFGSIFASRGCPFNCIFCASHKVWTKKVRMRSPENVVNEIKEIKNKFKTNLFRFEDDTFALSKDYVECICNLFKKEKLNIKWKAETRVELVTDGLIKNMRSAGCEELMLGVESGEEETLKRIKKDITVKQIKEAAKIIKDNKVKLGAYFMIGFPWETKIDIDKTVALMKDINPRIAYLSVATPYPGTELYDICLTEGLIPEKIDWSKFFHQSPDMYLTKNLAREDAPKIIEEVEKIFGKHNIQKMREILISNPFYVIKRLFKGNYCNWQDLKSLFCRYLWK